MNAKEIELLAPARDLECGKAAITYGADAVYVGGPDWGARRGAVNSVADIAALIEFAHLYRARVYVTVNTLLFDKELAAVGKFLHELYRIGADAAIIQDMGILEMDIPPIALIASTQTAVLTPEKARFFEDAGFTRIILPRELELAEIRAIRAATSIGLEAFIHGALCVSISGNCYLSAALGGRSGNRGECAQPCRKAYTLEDAAGHAVAGEQYLLSLRDFSAGDFVDDLIGAGVRSFKIEGRLKDAGYVKNVTAYYRRRLDRAIAEKGLRRSSSGTSVFDFDPDVRKSFNRGLTPYLLGGRRSGLCSRWTPKATGEPLGVVGTVGDGWFTLDGVELATGDGLCAVIDGELRGGTVEKISDGRVFVNGLGGLAPGCEIFRNRDSRFERRLSRSKTVRKIPVDVTLRGTGGELVIEFCDDDGIRSEVRRAVRTAAVRDIGGVRAKIEKTVGRLGDTPFTCRRVTVDTEAFAPASLLSEMRRELAALHVRNRIAACAPVDSPLERNETPYPTRRAGPLDNVANEYAVKFYRRHGVTEIEPAPDTSGDYSGVALMTSRYCIRRELGFCGEHAYCEPFYLVDDVGRRYRLDFDCAECLMRIYR